MDGATYPFPLAAHSAHHSHYHRFLLGVDARVLDPLPKPYCTGALARELPGLAADLSLARWRKLFQGSIPWVGGFGEEHYRVGNAPSNRPLPREYERPARRYGAFDFVQIADPSVSALALVAGDRRVVRGFVGLCDQFCAGIEGSAHAHAPGPLGTRATGRMLAGQFAEPSNRWLMPFLHVHARVLNLTSFREEPRRLVCLDPRPLGAAGLGERGDWVQRQAGLLRGLGYGAEVRGIRAPRLRVDGVPPALVSAMEAPRIAVLRLLERILVGERPRAMGSIGSELPVPVVAALVEQLESLVARSLSRFKPAKVDVPAGGPWRAAVREHLWGQCPGALAQADAAARRARAEPLESAVLPSPRLDASHCHAPDIASLGARDQDPLDPELGEDPEIPGLGLPESPWVSQEFGRALAEVNERLRRPADSLAPLRELLASIDLAREGASAEQLVQAQRLLRVEVDRAVGRAPQRAAPEPGPWRAEHPLDAGRRPRDHAPVLGARMEIGGRSL